MTGLDRIKRWCLLRAPEALDAFDPPAQASDVEALCAAVGALPADLIAFWRRCGGTQIPGPFPFSILSPQEALACWTQLQRNTVAVFPTATAVDPGLRPAWTHRGWVPLTDDGDGNHVCVDLAPGRDGRRGQVLVVLAHDPRRQVLASSWSAWVRSLADQLEGGTLVATEDRGHFFGVLRREDLVGPLVELRVRGESESARIARLKAGQHPPE
ncbi:MAG: SMI1/KNR4 family protein [Myxococcota bacterium]